MRVIISKWYIFVKWKYFRIVTVIINYSRVSTSKFPRDDKRIYFGSVCIKRRRYTQEYILSAKNNNNFICIH